MTYIGQQPATTFDSGIQDRFTGLTTNTVTLNHEISAEEDILVVWNNIVQDKNSYSVGGTGNKTVTLGGTLVSADVVTVYYLNKVMQSINPTAGSVSSTILGSDILSGQTDIGADIADAYLFLVDDGAGGTVRKTAASRLKTYASSVAGTNSFSVAGSGNQSSIADNTWTKITFDSENWDTDNLFASNKFVAANAGKYFFTANLSIYGDTDNGNSISGRFYKNGSGDSQTLSQIDLAGGSNIMSLFNLRVTSVLNLAATDYVELYGKFNTNSSTATAPAARSMMGFRVA